MNNEQKAKVAAIVAWIVYLGLIAMMFVVAAHAQTEWSHGRLECQAPNIGTVIEAIREEDGNVHSPRTIGYIGAQDTNRVFDYVMLPGRSYYNGCMFTQRDPIAYESWLYLPFAGQRGHPR